MYVKLTLRLEKEERTRVKLQEQMARLQQENLRLKSQERQRRLMEAPLVTSTDRQPRASASVDSTLLSPDLSTPTRPIATPPAMARPEHRPRSRGSGSDVAAKSLAQEAPQHQAQHLPVAV